MIFGQRFFIFILIIGAIASTTKYTQAMNGGGPNNNNRGVFDAGNMFWRMGSNPPRAIQNLMISADIQQSIRNLEVELENLKQLPDNDLGKNDKIAEQEWVIKALKKEYKTLVGAQSDSEKIGTIIARGLGGKAWDSFGIQQSADDFSDGIKKGLMIRISEAFGEAISSKVKSTIDLVLGGAWDFMLLSFLDSWDGICNILFHSGNNPFKTNEVEGWQKLIVESMKHVEKNVKDGPKDNFRGQDMTLRSFGGDDKEFEQHDDANNLTAWRMYVLGCIEQFDYFIELFEKRKKYYHEDKLIVFYAEQIQKRLGDYRDLMLKAKSVKEFDDFIESNKSLLPAMRENMEQLFKRLAEEAKPRSVFSNNNDSMRRTETTTRPRPMDDDMPNRFGNQWGV